MPRPLYILTSVKQEDPSITRKKIDDLLGEIINVSDKAYKCLAKCIQLLTEMEMERASAVDMHTVDLGVRVWNDLNISSELTKNGIYLQAMMMQRDAIETIAIIEYLHSFPEEAEAWWKAKTRKERLRFSINTIKDKIKDGQEMKDAWDSLSSYIHPNSEATSAYGADKPYFGHNLFLGGFYYPGTVRFDFLIQLDLCIELLEKMRDWYKNKLEFPNELSKEIDILRDEYDTQADYLKKRTKSEKKEVVDKVVATRLPKDEVIEWFKSLDNLS